MEIITYLLSKNKSSKEYYLKIDYLTQDIISKANNELNQLIKHYIKENKDKSINENILSEKFILDLLILGVLWKLHAYKAINFSKYKYLILIRLLNLRKKYYKYKSIIDKIRSIFITLFFVSKNIKKVKIDFNIKNFNKFLLWLKATGEYKQEVRRLSLLLNFFSKLSNEKLNLYSNMIFKFCNWFENETESELSNYLVNVDNFLQSALVNYKWREDLLFCTKQKQEYYLNMVGAEILKRVFQKDYSQTERKVVLLPACMRLLSAKKCQAKFEPEKGSICIGCNEDCNINKVTVFGKAHNFEVYIIEHSSDFSKWLKKYAHNKNIGVIGVTCILNLLTGGLEMERLGIAGHCVLLDYCGCKNHWHKKGVATCLDVEQLIS